MLDAAEQVFGRHGFYAASMDEIALRSGITKALLYQYFGSKEGLCEASSSGALLGGVHPRPQRHAPEKRRAAG